MIKKNRAKIEGLKSNLLKTREQLEVLKERKESKTKKDIQELYDADIKAHSYTKKMCGFIAQEVKKALVKGMQELSAKIDEQAGLIADLTTRLKALEDN